MTPVTSSLGRAAGAFGRWLDRVRENEHRLSLALSLVIGTLVALVVVAFILLTGQLAGRMYPPGGSGWRRLLVPTLGALVTGYLLFRYFPLARGSGIPQTKFALFVDDGRITLRTVLGKFLCCSTSLASGIALGREGPAVHMGAGIASVLARRLGLSTERVRALLPVGCAAALAAAFNTPIAAVLFALEEILGDLHAPVLGTVVLSSATAWMVLHLILGDEPLFHVAGYQLVHPAEFLVYAVLGVIGGLASVAFVKLLLGMRARFLRLNRGLAWLYPVVGGLTVGVIGWMAPDVLGAGYRYVERVLNGDAVLTTLAVLAVLKIVATATCYASGNAGGIFGPSLFIGAMLGGSVGWVAHEWLPAYTASPGAYALVGMGTAFAGIVRAPLTSVIMIFEVTRDYTIIVPLMISNLIAYYVSQRLQRAPIYEALALQDGVHLPTGEARADAGHARVAQVMRPAPDGLKPEAVVSQTADAPAPLVHPDHTLAVALQRMGATGARMLPVVSRADLRKLLGVVTMDDVLAGFGVAGEGSTRGVVVSAPEPEPPPLSTRAFLTTVAAVAVAIVALAAVDVVLAGRERAAVRAEARQLFEQGRTLEAAGRLQQAIERYHAAASIARGERDYQVALSRALLAAGRADDARRAIDVVLRDRATDGEANLVMARALAARGDPADAVSYYHRAIFGRWPDAGAERRGRVRVELVDLLARVGNKEELLAELLPLRSETTDPAVDMRIASLYLSAGVPDRAIETFQSVLRRLPNSARAHAGLGEAYLARGDPRAALASFRRALRLDPNTPDIRARVKAAEDALAASAPRPPARRRRR